MNIFEHQFIFVLHPFSWNILYIYFFSQFKIFQDHCKRDKAKFWIHYKPSLFQHIGTHSSLKGKVQRLKVSMNNQFVNLRK